GSRRRQGHPVRVQGLHARSRAGPVLTAEGHVDRVRRRDHPPRPPPRLRDRGRPDSLGGRARLAHAPRRGARAQGGVGPVPDPAPASVRPEAAVSPGLRVLLIRAAYASALIGAVAWMLLVLYAADRAGTLGYDFQAYDLAVDRMLAGQTMYSADAQAMGGFGLFFY